MALRDAVRAFDADLRLKVYSPSLQKLQRAAARVERLADGLDDVDIEQLPEVVSVTTSALRAGHLPDRRVTKLVSMGGLEEVVDAEDGQALVQTFIDELKKNVSQRILKALLVGYLRQSFKHQWLAKTLRQFITVHIDHLPQRWRTRVDRFALLAEDPGVKLANMLLEPTAPSPFELLTAAGLKGVLGQGGFAQQVFARVCKALSRGHSEVAIQRFWEYTTGDNVRFKNHLINYSKALLSPYKEAAAPDLLKTDITHFLVDNFGDPRTRPSAWRGVSEDELNVLKRWLTEQSFELLMQVVKQSNDTEQWRERVRFWQPYIDAGYVSEAWVALGSRAERIAKGMVREGLLHSRASYGVFKSGSSVDPMHSVIMMRIGEITVSEWTHSGKLRFYRKENSHAPKLYRSEYNVENIRNDYTCDHYIIHKGWQGEAESVLKRYTGIAKPTTQRRPSPTHAGRDAAVRGNQCSLCHSQVNPAELDDKGVCYTCRGIRVRNR